MALFAVFVAINTEVAPVKVGHACEGRKMTIECEFNQIISVTGATYGYNGSETCRNEGKKEPCHVNITTEVAKRCNELSKCDVFVNFTEDRCPQDTYKEAKVQYQCLEKETLTRCVCIGGTMKLDCPKNQRIQITHSSLEVAPIKYGYACEGMKMTLKCESNQSIAVTSATYGYNDSGKCHNEVKKEPCLVDMKTEVARRCNELSTCEVSVNFTKDPCPKDTYKEAIVQYQCLEKETCSLEVAPIKVGYACEGMKMTLKCESNQSISVTSATYGYNDSGKCHNEVKKEPCLVDMKTEVARRCNELSTCEVSVNFTKDPCPKDTYKEAIVQYQCLEKETYVMDNAAVHSRQTKSPFRIYARRLRGH
ncbi:hypothetical protein Btru_026105 [Bulinus truncatus]|nr:hypothetical protein Btru_026105 [Bulinus truncatus]